MIMDVLIITFHTMPELQKLASTQSSKHPAVLVGKININNNRTSIIIAKPMTLH